MNQWVTVRERQICRSVPVDQSDLQGADLEHALEDLLAREWLSKEDEDAYRDL